MFLFFPPAWSATIDVCAPTCAPGAVEFAWGQAQDGDILEIDTAGTYSGNLAVATRNLTVRGTVPGVVIDLRLTGFAGGSATLENVVVDCSAGMGDTHAIAGDNNVDLTIRRSEIRNCSGADGGFANLRRNGGGSLIVEDSWIHDNHATGDGGAFFVDEGNTVLLERNLFCDNEAVDHGGAVFVEDATSAILRRNLFVRSTADKGGAIYLKSDGLLERNTFVEGFASPGEGGGIHLSPSPVENVVGNLFVATLGGDGIAHEAPDGLYSHNGFWNNLDFDVEGSITAGTDALFLDPAFLSSACDPSVYLLPTASPLLTGGPGGQPVGALADAGEAADGAWSDLDGDGQLALFDCEDDDATVGPGFLEVCDGQDTDCNGLVDDGCIVVEDDLHGDGVGASLDCDDTDPDVFPGNPEVCDGLDNDCSGGVDDGLPFLTVYADLDGDGFGDPASVQVTCAPDPEDVDLAGDCDDLDPAVSPAAQEICDALDVDEDCDGVADDADPSVTGQVTVFEDLDGDGYGGAAFMACDDSGPLAQDDCDDTDASRNPGAQERCDDHDLDEDCDGLADDDDPDVVGQITRFVDNDGDGFGSDAFLTCGSSGSDRDDDCDDEDPTVHPGASETWYDGTDQDCDGNDDDADGDGSPVPDDCDDTSSAIHPGADDVPDDGIDQDCDGVDPVWTYGNGCSSTPSGGFWLLWLLAAFVQPRRSPDT